MKLASFEAIAAALDDADVRYLVAGGLAMKLVANRPRDLDDIEHLEMILAEQQRHE